MTIKKPFYTVTYAIAFSLVMMGCNANPDPQSKTEQKLNTDNTIAESTAEPKNNSFCPVIASRNWHAWIDRVAENEPRLNISGEVDLPTPGYQVEVKPGILDRRQPPTQRFSLSFTPPEGIVAQVITPTQVRYTMPTSILEYRSIMIYCGDKLLVEIPDVTPQETATLPIEVGAFKPNDKY